MGRGKVPIWTADDAAGLLGRSAPVETHGADRVEAMLDHLGGSDGSDGSERQLIACGGPAKGWVLATDRRGFVRMVSVRHDAPRERWLSRPESSHTVHTVLVTTKSAHRIEPLHRAAPSIADVVDGRGTAVVRLFTTKRIGDVKPAAAVLPDGSVIHPSTVMVRRTLGSHVDQTWWWNDRVVARSVILPTRWGPAARWGIRYSADFPEPEQIALVAILVRGQYIDWSPD